MLKAIFGSEAAGKVLGEILEKGSTNAYAAAKNRGIGLNSAREQLDKFHKAGILKCDDAGKSWDYSFNEKNELTKPLKTLLRVMSQ